MRIGLLTTSFPRHAGDYAGSFVGDRVRQLLADGHAVDVLAAGDGSATREIAHPRLTVTRIDPPAFVPSCDSLFYGDGAPEIVQGSGGGFVHAMNHLGAEPAGWPKFTNGWMIPIPVAGDIDGPRAFT